LENFGCKNFSTLKDYKRVWQVETDHFSAVIDIYGKSDIRALVYMRQDRDEYKYKIFECQKSSVKAAKTYIQDKMVQIMHEAVRMVDINLDE